MDRADGPPDFGGPTAVLKERSRTTSSGRPRQRLLLDQDQRRTAAQRAVIRRSSCHWLLSAVPAAPIDGQPTVYLCIGVVEVNVLMTLDRVVSGTTG